MKSEKKTKQHKDVFEGLFGKRPKKGFKFTHVEVEIIDNKDFKGFDIGWSAQGIGFGHVAISWGVGNYVKRNWPQQYGFYVNTENMSDEFIHALMKKALPKITELMLKHKRF